MVASDQTYVRAAAARAHVRVCNDGPVSLSALGIRGNRHGRLRMEEIVVSRCWRNKQGLLALPPIAYKKKTVSRVFRYNHLGVAPIPRAFPSWPITADTQGSI